MLMSLLELLVEGETADIAASVELKMIDEAAEF